MAPTTPTTPMTPTTPTTDARRSLTQMNKRRHSFDGHTTSPAVSPLTKKARMSAVVDMALSVKDLPLPKPSSAAQRVQTSEASLDKERPDSSGHMALSVKTLSLPKSSSADRQVQDSDGSLDGERPHSSSLITQQQSNGQQLVAPKALTGDPTKISEPLGGSDPSLGDVQSASGNDTQFNDVDMSHEPVFVATHVNEDVDDVADGSGIAGPSTQAPKDDDDVKADDTEENDNEADDNEADDDEADDIVDDDNYPATAPIVTRSLSFSHVIVSKSGWVIADPSTFPPMELLTNKPAEALSKLANAHRIYQYIVRELKAHPELDTDGLGPLRMLVNIFKDVFTPQYTGRYTYASYKARFDFFTPFMEILQNRFPYVYFLPDNVKKVLNCCKKYAERDVFKTKLTKRDERNWWWIWQAFTDAGDGVLSKDDGKVPPELSMPKFMCYGSALWEAKYGTDDAGSVKEDAESSQRSNKRPVRSRRAKTKSYIIDVDADVDDEDDGPLLHDNSRGSVTVSTSGTKKADRKGKGRAGKTSVDGSSNVAASTSESKGAARKSKGRGMKMSAASTNKKVTETSPTTSVRTAPSYPKYHQVERFIYPALHTLIEGSTQDLTLDEGVSAAKFGVPKRTKILFPFKGEVSNMLNPNIGELMTRLVHMDSIFDGLSSTIIHTRELHDRLVADLDHHLYDILRVCRADVMVSRVREIFKLSESVEDTRLVVFWLVDFNHRLAATNQGRIQFECPPGIVLPPDVVIPASASRSKQ